MNVLIVDDSQVVAERLERMLTEASEDIRVVWHAQSPAEGKQALHCARPDAIILDVRMPGGNGFEVLAEAKKRAPPPLVIMLTNYPLPQYRQRSMKAGADYFFDKSTEFDHVPKVLLGMLRDRRGNGGDRKVGD
jgi:two-component system response regulator DevR